MVCFFYIHTSYNHYGLLRTKLRYSTLRVQVAMKQITGRLEYGKVIDPL